MVDTSKKVYDRKVSTYSDNLRFVLLNLFGFNPEVVVFVTTKGIVIPFLRLFKCANEGISANLFNLNVKKPTFTFVREPMQRFMSGFTQTARTSASMNPKRRTI